MRATPTVPVVTKFDIYEIAIANIVTQFTAIGKYKR